MPPPLRSTSRSVLHWFLVAWFCLTLPVAALFLVNRYLRFEFFETINHYVAKVGGLDYVFIGDSITVGGHNFGWSLFGNPFLSRNLGCNGYTVRQVLDLVPQALECHPRWVFILAGTNDFLNDEYDQEKMLQEYRLMLAGIKNGHARAVVTLVPQTAAGEHTKEIDSFNDDLRKLCLEQSVPVIDLNSQIAPDGKLLPQFTVDGIHFSRAAYKIWLSELRKVISG